MSKSPYRVGKRNLNEEFGEHTQTYGRNLASNRAVGYCSSKWKANIIANAKKVPGFLGFTGFKIGAFDSDILLPVTEYAKIYRMTRKHPEEFDESNPYNYTYNIPKTRLMVSVPSGLSKSGRQVVKNQISSIVDTGSNKLEDSVLVIDTISEIEKVEKSMIIMNFLNLVISTISLVLAFFLLIISIAGNIRDSTYEIAVLRAIGMTGREIVNVYVLEVLSNNIASISLGLMVGISVSATLGTQYFSLMEIPFQLLLPYKMIFIMITISMAILFIGTYTSTKAIGMKSIAGILKSGSL
jgi:ABC-type antimicrobial peptide transport system permease subunit